jgi:hypothetical protein
MMRKFILITILFIICSLPALANTVDETIARGNYCMSQGNYQSAIDYYNQALQIDPYSRDAWFYEANAYQSMNNWYQARACCDRVLEFNSNDIGGLLMRGSIQALGFGDYKEAINSYDRLLTIDPYNTSAWSYKGNAYGGLNNCDKAILCYNRALNIDPGFTYAQSWKDRTLTVKKDQQWDQYHEWLQNSQRNQANQWYRNNQGYNNNQNNQENNQGYYTDQGKQEYNSNQNNQGIRTPGYYNNIQVNPVNKSNRIENNYLNCPGNSIYAICYKINKSSYNQPSWPFRNEPLLRQDVCQPVFGTPDIECWQIPILVIGESQF